MKTIKFENVYINNYYSLLGRNEHNPSLKVDKIIDDYYNNEKTIELGEKSYQIESINGLLNKTLKQQKDIDLLIGSDLQNQLLATHLSAKEFNISHLGVYSACASFTESLIIGSSFVEGKMIGNCIINISSHNLASEKQFRYPIEYGAIRKKVNTFTATGSVSTLISNNPSQIKVESATIGKVVDLNYKDANNMGACMAPSAAEVIYEHFKSLKRNHDYYDIILTGDLGIYGVEILKDYLLKKYDFKINNIKDSGALIFNAKDNSKIAGGSGPVCLPLVLFNEIINKNYKKILIVGTGSLHSQLSTNLKLSIPSISHAVSLEVNL